LWAKTFSALLIGTGDWYSKRCKLTWKLKGTKYNRLYFQLQASAIAPTKGTEFGLLHTEQQHLLKTPTAMDGEVTSGKKNPVSGNSGTLAQEIMSGYKPTMEKLGLLPTPTTMDMLPPKTDKAWEKEMTETRPGRTMPSNLRDVPFRTGLLPTPKVGGKECYETRAKRQGHDKAISHLEAFVEYQTGKTSQLSPHFVLELMGFPPNWTELPFLNGETNQSRPPETPLCPK
jgi:hypothetical protein